MPREQLAERRDLHAAAATDHVRDDPCPPRLVRGPEPGTVVAVEVLAEDDVVLPGGIRLQPLDPAEARSPPVLVDEEEGDQPAPDVLSDLAQRHLAPDPVGYSSVSSSPK